MDSTFVIILAVLLVLAIVVGPAVGFWFARRRMESRGRRREPVQPDYQEFDRNLATLGDLAMEPSPVNFPGQVAARMDAAPRQFDLEPPIFGPASGSIETPRDPSIQAGPTAASSDLPIPAPRNPAEPTGLGPPHDVPAPQAPYIPPAGSNERPQFDSLLNLMNDQVARRLAWLGSVSSGALLALHRLGYDDPVKIANLRPGEVSRLAKTLQIEESLIVHEWIPAARRELGIRNPTE